MFFKSSQRPANQGLLLGWETNGVDENVGLSTVASSKSDFKSVTYDGDGHLLTCAPTGMGKGRGVLIPNSLLYKGPIIAVDPKGELCQVAGRQRQRLGDQLVILDPWHIVTEHSDGLNPLDILNLPGSSIDGDAEMLATLLSAGHQSTTDPFWSDMGTGLVSGLIAHVANSHALADRHLGRVRDWIYHDDMDMAIAKALDDKSVNSRMARDQFVAYLTAPWEATRPCIRSTACSYVNPLGSAEVAATLKASTFRLQDVVEGRPLSIFIVIPPEKLESHRALLRLWVGTLLTAVVRRKRIPAQRTLALIDECAQLGTLPALRQAVTLLRGSGLQVWTVWQDLSQLRLHYPLDWPTMVNNSAVLQVFGINNNLMAKEWAELLGKEPAELLRLAPEQAVLCMHGQGTRTCRRPDYLTDRAFAGLYDANQRFAGRGQAPNGR
jgi:type IV secretion system protein VirD4